MPSLEYEHEPAEAAAAEAIPAFDDDAAMAALDLAGPADETIIRSEADLARMNALGARVRLCGPPTLVPPGLDHLAPVTTNIDEALDGADAIMMLRVQMERMAGGFFPSLREYFRVFGMTEARLRLARPDVMIMHPGPMNRGVEIASEVADGPYSVILDQVANGVAVRMAVLYLLAGGAEHEEAA